MDVVEEAFARRGCSDILVEHLATRVRLQLIKQDIDPLLWTVLYDPRMYFATAARDIAREVLRYVNDDGTLLSYLHRIDGAIQYNVSPMYRRPWSYGEKIYVCGDLIHMNSEGWRPRWRVRNGYYHGRCKEVLGTFEHHVRVEYFHGVWITQWWPEYNHHCLRNIWDGSEDTCRIGPVTPEARAWCFAKPRAEARSE